MYILASDIENLPVISLQTGETIARLHRPVIDMGRLEISAFRCEDMSSHESHILLPRDIRQFASDGLLIDNEDELSGEDDVVRMRPLMKQDFNPRGKTVVSDLGRRLGSVDNYSINLETKRIQKLYLKQPLLRSWMGTNLTIDRTQILDVTPKKIVVRDSVLSDMVVHTSMPETPA
jgi:sporulation protein YlmC with PRC-barrel domain